MTANTLLIANNNGTSTGGVTGTVSFDAGTFTVNTLNMAIKTAAGVANANATLNVGGGNFTVNTAFTFGSQATAGTATATLNLTGGTFTSNVNITKGAGSTTATLNFDGGTLRPGLNSATFLQGLDAAVVKSGGALIDTNGRNVTIAQPLLAGTPSGGLTKQGLGSLTLSGASTYSGATPSRAGAGVSGSLDTQTSTVTVASGATLGGTAINRPLNVAGGNVDPGNMPANAVGTMTTNASVAFAPARLQRPTRGLPQRGSPTQAGGTINLANATLFASGISGFARGPSPTCTRSSRPPAAARSAGPSMVWPMAEVPVNGELFTIN